MKKLSLLILVMMVTWIVAGCSISTTSDSGCFGFWESNRWGLKRGTIAGKNTEYSKPYRQCVEIESPHRNTERRKHG